MNWESNQKKQLHFPSKKANERFLYRCFRAFWRAMTEKKKTLAKEAWCVWGIACVVNGWQDFEKQLKKHHFDVKSLSAENRMYIRSTQTIKHHSQSPPGWHYISEDRESLFLDGPKAPTYVGKRPRRLTTTEKECWFLKSCGAQNLMAWNTRAHGSASRIIDSVRDYFAWN